MPDFKSIQAQNMRRIYAAIRSGEIPANPGITANQQQTIRYLHEIHIAESQASVKLALQGIKYHGGVK